MAVAGENPFNLEDVVDVVGGHVTGEVSDGDGAAFGMMAWGGPLLRCETGQKAQIGFAEQAEHFDGVAQSPGCVIAELRPQILIEAHESDAREFNHLAITPTGGQFVFGEMGNNFENRPFLRGGAASQFFIGDAGDQAKQSAGSGALHFERIFAGDVRGKPLLVLFGRFCLRHVLNPTRLSYRHATSERG